MRAQRCALDLPHAERGRPLPLWRATTMSRDHFAHPQPQFSVTLRLAGGRVWPVSGLAGGRVGGGLVGCAGLLVLRLAIVRVGLWVGWLVVGLVGGGGSLGLCCQRYARHSWFPHASHIPLIWVVLQEAHSHSHTCCNGHPLGQA